MINRALILILLTVAYMIVIGHDVIPHEHFDDDFMTEHHHPDNMNDESHHEDHHLLFSHSYLIFHSKENEIVFVSSGNDVRVDFISFVAIVTSHLFQTIPLDTSPPVFSDIGKTLVSAYIESSGNRAPPANSI